MAVMKVLIWINNRVLTEGLKTLVQAHLGDVEVSDSFSAPVISPDIVLFDSREEIGQLKQQFPDARFICLDLGLKDPDLACLVFCHEVSGIISPGLDLAMFGKALRTVNAGEVWLEQTHLKAMMRQGRSLPQIEGLNQFSEQDRRIIRLVADGLRNQQIADLLCLSEPTVKAHLGRIYKKLNINSRSSLVALAAKSGWTHH